MPGIGIGGVGGKFLQGLINLQAAMGKVGNKFKQWGKTWSDVLKKNEEATKRVTKKIEAMGEIFGKISSLPGISAIIKLFSQLMGGALAPGLSAFMEAMERIGDILSIILVPLQPFLDLLSIIAQVLEAALAPMLGEIYTLLQPVIEELVGMIPELTEAVMEWLEADNGLMEGIQAIMESLPLLLEGLIGIIPMIGQMVVIFAKQMLPMLIKLIPTFLELAIVFAKELFPALVKVMPSLMQMVGAFIELFTALAPLAGPLASIISVLTWFIGSLVGAYLGFQMAGPYGALIGFILGGTLDIIRAATAQEGGIFTQPGLVMIDNPPEKIIPLEDEDQETGGINVNFQGNVIGNDDFIDNLMGEMQRRRALGDI